MLCVGILTSKKKDCLNSTFQEKSELRVDNIFVQSALWRNLIENYNSYGRDILEEDKHASNLMYKLYR